MKHKFRTLKEFDIDKDIMKSLKLEAFEYIKRQTIADSEEYNKIQMFFHCGHCMDKAKSEKREIEPKEFYLEAGATQSLSKILIQCAECKRPVQTINLAETQNNWIRHFFNIE